MEQQSVVLARRWFEEVWNERRPEAVDELMAADGVGHHEGVETHGPTEFKEVRQQLLAAFPDIRISIEDVVGDDTQAVVRWRASARHRGELMGIKASGRDVDFPGMTWFRFRDGQVVEGWDSWNQGALLQKLA